MLRGLWRAMLLLWCLCAVGVAVGAEEGQALQGGVNPGFHEPPAWFKTSFLDLREDVAEAKQNGRRVMLFFYQDGCPYCKKLIDENFGRADITAKTQRLYDVIAINIWGDRELTDLAGDVMPEKRFAEQRKVMYTPTLLFLDEQGATVLRLNGYYAPDKFSLALDYGALHDHGGTSFRDYLAAHLKASGQGLIAEPYFLKPPYRLARNRVPAQRPLAVLFEQQACETCAEFHRDVLARPQTRELLQRFDVVQLDVRSEAPLLAPDGSRTTVAAWAKALNVQYTPSLVLFDERGREVFRTEAYLRAFHVQSVLDYVASGAYRKQPNLQRFIQERADRLREQGVTVDLMK